MRFLGSHLQGSFGDIQGSFGGLQGSFVSPPLGYLLLLKIRLVPGAQLRTLLLPGLPPILLHQNPLSRKALHDPETTLSRNYTIKKSSTLSRNYTIKKLHYQETTLSRKALHRHAPSQSLTSRKESTEEAVH